MGTTTITIVVLAVIALIAVLAARGSGSRVTQIDRTVRRKKGGEE